MDTHVKPGDDFFMYANGAWVAGTEIPPDRSTYSRAARMAERAAEQINGLITQLAKTHPKPGSDNAKVLDYYMSYLDEAAIEARGLAPLNGALTEIAEIKSKADLAKVLGSQLRADVDVLNATNLATPNLFGLWVAQDLDDPSRNLPFILQGGLIMPSRDYYVGTSQRMADLRAKYVAHISRMLTLAGIDGAEAKAQAIMALETKIAASHWSTADTFEIEKANNHWARVWIGTLILRRQGFRLKRILWPGSQMRLQARLHWLQANL
jgi:predicted metalloendopeptidase